MRYGEFRDIMDCKMIAEGKATLRKRYTFDEAMKLR